jgi:hypothetical protein
MGPVAERRKVMYLLSDYPALSETYIRTEIDAIARDHDVAIVARYEANVPYRDHLPYTVERDRDAVCELVEDFRPDVLHTHWLVEAPMVHYVGTRTGVPFTVRTHSFDMLWGGRRSAVFNAVPGRMAAFAAPPQVRSAAQLLSDELCLGVIAFPFTWTRLRKLGVPDEKLRACYPVVNVRRFHDRSPNGDGVMDCGPAMRKKAMDDFLDLAEVVPERPFTLYAIDWDVDALEARNAKLHNPARIPGPIDHAEMPAEYKKQHWLVKTADAQHRTVAWPVSVAEAQASGVGVCMANLGSDLKEYVGPGGFLYDSIADARDIVAKPFPDELREASFEHAKKSDIETHRSVLTDLWPAASS